MQEEKKTPKTSAEAFDEWNRRRSERIFLNEAGMISSPPLSSKKSPPPTPPTPTPTTTETTPSPVFTPQTPPTPSKVKVTAPAPLSPPQPPSLTPPSPLPTKTKPATTLENKVKDKPKVKCQEVTVEKLSKVKKEGGETSDNAVPEEAVVMTNGKQHKDKLPVVQVSRVGYDVMV